MIGQKALLNGIDLLEEQRHAHSSLCIGSCIIEIIVIITSILIIISISRQRVLIQISLRFVEYCDSLLLGYCST